MLEKYMNSEYILYTLSQQRERERERFLNAQICVDHSLRIQLEFNSAEKFIIYTSNHLKQLLSYFLMRKLHASAINLFMVFGVIIHWR